MKKSLGVSTSSVPSTTHRFSINDVAIPKEITDAKK